MKRFMFFLAVLMLMAGFGCDNIQNPASGRALKHEDGSHKLNTETINAGQRASSAHTNHFAGGIIRVPEHFDSIQGAVAASQPGDSIIVNSSGSPYNENVTIDTTKRRLYIETDGSVIINGSIKILADSVTIDSFTVNVTSANSGGIHIQNASGVRILNNRVKGGGSGGDGIVLSGSNCLVKNNVCADLTYGIYLLYESNNNVVTENIVYCNTVSNIIDLGTDNIIFENDTGPIYGSDCL